MNELNGKLCKDKLVNRYIRLFDELKDKAESCNNVATLQNIKIEADALKVRLLNEIAVEEAKMQPKPQPDPNPNPDPVKPQPQPQPVIKKKRSISIKTINTATTWQLETEVDVEKYISELRTKLISRLEKDTVINIEF